jgi:hypothetical protein
MFCSVEASATQKTVQTHTSQQPSAAPVVWLYTTQQNYPLRPHHSQRGKRLCLSDLARETKLPNDIPMYGRAKWPGTVCLSTLGRLALNTEVPNHHECNVPLTQQSHHCHA